MCFVSCHEPCPLMPSCFSFRVLFTLFQSFIDHCHPVLPPPLSLSAPYRRAPAKSPLTTSILSMPCMVSSELGRRPWFPSGTLSWLRAPSPPSFGLFHVNIMVLRHFWLIFWTETAFWIFFLYMAFLIESEFHSRILAKFRFLSRFRGSGNVPNQPKCRRIPEDTHCFCCNLFQFFFSITELSCV